jgi:hypothetical protein
MSYCIDDVIMGYYQRYQVSRVSYLIIMTTAGSILSLLGVMISLLFLIKWIA